jgi:hypothetical protein
MSKQRSRSRPDPAEPLSARARIQERELQRAEEAAETARLLEQMTDDVVAIEAAWPLPLKTTQRPICRSRYRAGPCGLRMVLERQGATDFIWSCPRRLRIPHPSRHVDRRELATFARSLENANAAKS